MRARWSTYLVALVAVAVALALRGALSPWLGERVPYITLFGAVIVAAWQGGAGPAFLAAALGWIGAEFFFIPPLGAIVYRGPHQVVELSAYLLSTALIAGLAGAMQRTRAKLQESERRFRSFMEHTPAFVFLKDAQGRYLFANEAGRALLGAQWLGKNDAELLPAEVAERVMENDRRVLEIDAPATFDLRMGDLRLHSTKFPLRDAAGARYVGVVTIDVTAQRRSEEQLQLVTNTVSAGMVRISADLRYVWANRVFAAWAGTTPEGLVGRHVREVIGDEGVRALEPYSKELRAGRRVEYERLAHFGGRGLRWIYCVGEPIFDAAGQPDGWVVVISDIHERKQAQEALREADRRKDEFLAVLAHELRNPLAPIRNAVTLLAHEQGLPPKLEWARAVIDRQVEQMTRLIEDLLDVARITSGKLSIRREAVSLAAVIDLALETSRPHIDAAAQLLSVRLGEEAWLDADPTRLAQVFSNLLNTAAKYTPRGGSIALAARRDGAELVVTIEDTGRGFPPEMAEKIFEPFSQWNAEGQTSAGLGIGLALVRGIVGLHGGRVEAASAGPGKGSRFVVRLPSTQAVARASPAHVARAPDAAGTRVLVADDNRDAADTLARILATYGHEVRVVYDGHAALDECERFAPHVAVLDVGMPGADGYEVARTLRNARGTRPKLIALTGWGQEADRNRAIDAGFDHHLTKPADPQSVHELIVKSCRKALM